LNPVFSRVIARESNPGLVSIGAWKYWLRIFLAVLSIFRGRTFYIAWPAIPIYQLPG
jgi:hypothetical protein